MTATEILSSLTDTLLGDERILNAQERELLTNLLQRIKLNAGAENASAVISRSVGEIGPSAPIAYWVRVLAESSWIAYRTRSGPLV